MKIGLVIYGSLETVSGGYLYDRKLVEFLRAQGDEVRVISLPWRNYALHLTDNFHFRLPRDLDLLIEDELNHPSLLAANARPRSYPVVSLVHHLRSSERRPAWHNTFYRLVEKRYLCSVDGFIFNSQSTRQVVEGLIGSDKPHVVAYPPTDRFGPPLDAEGVRARLQQAPPLRLLFVGNLIPRKGLHTLLQALARLPDTFQLDVVGSPEMDRSYSQRIRRLVKSLGLEGRVRFHGQTDGDALRERFLNAHLLVVPSSFEGFGIVYLEGMGFGLPAIGTVAEVIEDGKTGYLVPPENPTALAERLTRLATDRALLERLSLNALERYARQPTWAETAKRIRLFLLEMVERYGQTHRV